MAYIHELDDWPNLTWDDAKLLPLLSNVRHRQGRLLGRMEGLGFRLRAEASLTTLTAEHWTHLDQSIGDQVLTLSAARSVSARVFTEAEQAQNHCQIGNTGLAVRVILDWLDAVGGRATPEGDL